ncbi:DMT family transporter [Phreatobacter stygius]|uniref:DMT family transporter n=1 Tax=Phreatobacter stygius TaxID=1940610 RepID=A0A4D7BDX0_9HYPH|nr:DMT family transporter [Phreatobacter stygius]QCI68713.1 DMT family transporter [Phreatobacter stygius]
MVISATRQAAVLLVATGLFLGATFPIGKLAGEAGVPPTSWVFAMTSGASLFLLAWALLAGRRLPASRLHLRYYLISAPISFVIPNLIIFFCIPRIGAGLTSVMLALSPVLTLALARLLRMRRLDVAGVAGIALGLIGALIIIATRNGGGVGQPAALGWVALALLIPAFLAAGNIYRTLHWPDGADPLALAAATNITAAAMLFLAVFLSGEGSAGLASLAATPGLLAAQILSTGMMLSLFFRLQQVGGPVYLSQIGYVAAAVGLVSGTVMLGESYPLATWLGALVIVAGVALVTYSQARQ